MTPAEALRWLSSELEVEIAGLKEDRMRMLVSAGARSRVEALSEVATKCRMAANRVERGERL